MPSSFYSELLIAQKYRVSSTSLPPVRFPKRKGKERSTRYPRRNARRPQVKTILGNAEQTNAKKNVGTARPAKHNILPYMQI